jgi:hypothetical protein
MRVLASLVVFVALAAPASAQEPVELGPPGEFDAPGHAGPIATGDFDEDGDVDVAVADSDTNSVAILLGDGAGGLSAPSVEPLGIGPVVGAAGASAIVVGDFGGSPSLDVAVLLEHQGSVVVLIGDGNGDFGPPLHSPAGDGESGHMSAADVDGDADLDLAVGHPDRSVDILVGDDTGTFTAGQSLADAGTLPLLTDLNGNGSPDLAVSYPTPTQVKIFTGLGQGTFTFSDTADVTPSNGIGAPYAGRFNVDAHTDLVVGSVILLGDGNGGVSSGVEGRHLFATAVSDLDRDGFSDAIGPSPGGGAAVIVYTGGFFLGCGCGFPTGQDSSPAAVTVGDLNGDGKPDVVTSEFTEKVVVLLNLSPPNTFASREPAGQYSRQSTQTFVFESPQPGTTFECSVDGGPFTACSSPFDVTTADGRRTFAVRARDAAGIADPTPAADEWTVDTTPPQPFAQLGPESGQLVQSSTVTFTWERTTDETSGVWRYLIVIDDRAPVDAALCDEVRCSITIGDLGDGAHTWEVFALDFVGNERGTGRRSFTIDTAAPGALGLQRPLPGAALNTPRPRLTWQGAEGAAHYVVFVDGAEAGQTTGLEFLTDPLAQGSHAWFVEAVDAAGHRTRSTERTFVIDTSNPLAALQVRDNPTVNGRRVRFDASGSSDAVTGIRRYQWDLNGNGRFERDTGSDPTTSRRYRKPGRRRITVRVVDEAGNREVRTRTLRVRPRPPRGAVGISVDRGRLVTRDRRVKLRIVWPRLAYAMLISNDGGFDRARRFRVRRDVRWRLRRGGDGIRFVYVRFLGGPTGSQTFQDDIRLDRR